MTTYNATLEMCVYDELLNDIAERPYWVQVAFPTLMLSIFVTGLIGNLLTCAVIYCDRSMHTATNYYLFNLAVSDLLVAFGILFNINALSDYPIKFEGACRVHYFFVGALFNNSVLIMTALAIERYIAIWHPLLLNRSRAWRRVMKTMYVIWTVAILEALPEVWTVHLIRTKTSTLCFIVPSRFAKLLNGVLAVVTFVAPLAIMTFVYAMIAFKVNITQRNYSKEKIFNQRNNSKRVNKLVIALTLSFLVCWLPFFIMRVLVAIADCSRTSWFLEHMDVLMMFCSVNGWFSIVLNPMLFSLMSTKFRKALKVLWDTKFRRQKTVLQTTQTALT